MEKYVRVSREILLTSKDKINMDLFFLRTGKDGKQEYVLFAKAGMGRMAFKKIADNPVGALHIREENWDEYAKMLEDNLEFMADDPRIPLPEKSEIVYESAIDVVRDTFEDPRAGKNIQRSRSTVNNMVKFALSEPGAIKSLLSISQKDYYTFSHCVHVSVFSVGLAKVFNIQQREDLFELGLGALLHDVGKTKVNSAILNKPGKLTPEEFEEIKKHPQWGWELLKDMIPKRSLDIVLHHHERFNGLGYPDGLSKDEISLFAKIACIADVYDALTTNRVYAKARNPFEAIITMKQEMIGHFEEEKFMAFIRMLGPGVEV